MAGRGKASEADLDLIFRAARTQRSWHPEAIAEELLRRVYDLAKMGPTSANCSPARFIFVVSPEGKEKLRPALSAGNVTQTMTAAVTAIVGHDLEFHEKLPELYREADAKAWFAGSPELIRETAFRNGSMQGAYLILAARAMGLDAGPMSGFNQDKVNAAFWPEGRVKANFLCNIGCGDDARLKPRNTRLSFEEACRIV
jgi:3-hydroxypropanoate dehydrogenase